MEDGAEQARPRADARSASGDGHVSERMHIYMRIMTRVEAHATRMAHRELAAEITQDIATALLASVRGTADWEPPADPDAFAATSVRNRLVDVLRSDLAWGKLVEDEATIAISARNVSGSDNPDDDLMVAELAERIERGLALVPRAMRDAWTVWHEGADFPQVASELGVNEKTVRTYIARVNQSLQATLQPYLKEGR